MNKKIGALILAVIMAIVSTGILVQATTPYDAISGAHIAFEAFDEGVFDPGPPPCPCDDPNDDICECCDPDDDDHDCCQEDCDGDPVDPDYPCTCCPCHDDPYRNLGALKIDFGTVDEVYTSFDIFESIQRSGIVIASRNPNWEVQVAMTHFDYYDSVATNDDPIDTFRLALVPRVDTQIGTGWTFGTPVTTYQGNVIDIPLNGAITGDSTGVRVANALTGAGASQPRVGISFDSFIRIDGFSYQPDEEDLEAEITWTLIND